MKSRQLDSDVNSPGLELCVYFLPWSCFCTLLHVGHKCREPRRNCRGRWCCQSLPQAETTFVVLPRSLALFFISISSDSAAGLAQLDSRCAHLAMTWWSFVHVDSSLHVCINAHADLSLHSYMYMCIHVGLRVCIQLMPSNCSTPFVRLTLIYTVLFSRTTTTVAGYRDVAGQLFSDV